MKVRVTIEVSEEDRRAIAYSLSQEGLASRTDVEVFIHIAMDRRIELALKAYEEEVKSQG